VHGDLGSVQRYDLLGGVRGDSIELVQYWDSTSVRARFRGAIRDGRLAGTRMMSARRGEALTDTSFGGNMDYNELREGATVYLTVNEPGALIFVGDGHAVQGDGELTGDALETSMDVEFSVDIVRGITIGGPRAENAEYLMSIGIAGDLQEALRVATADMARWLAGDYKLNSAELASMLGTALRYDVADLVGTQLSIVAKVPRAVLANLQRAK